MDKIPPSVPTKPLIPSQNHSASPENKVQGSVPRSEMNGERMKKIDDYKIDHPVVSAKGCDLSPEVKGELAACVNAAYKDENKLTVSGIKDDDTFFYTKNNDRIVATLKYKKATTMVPFLSHKDVEVLDGDCFVYTFASTEKGQGSDLLIRFEDFARNNQFNRVILDLWEEGSHPLHIYYENHGYHSLGEDRFEYNGCDYVATRYAKVLSDSDT